jgi:hypothetical protein
VVTNRDGCLYIKICNEAKKNVINRQVGLGWIRGLLPRLQRRNCGRGRLNKIYMKCVKCVFGQDSTFSPVHQYIAAILNLARSERSEVFLLTFVNELFFA